MISQVGCVHRQQHIRLRIKGCLTVHVYYANGNVVYVYNGNVVRDVHDDDSVVHVRCGNDDVLRGVYGNDSVVHVCYDNDDMVRSVHGTTAWCMSSMATATWYVRGV